MNSKIKQGIVLSTFCLLGADAHRLNVDSHNHIK
jgi:hypothetical protein